MGAQGDTNKVGFWGDGRRSVSTPVLEPSVKVDHYEQMRNALEVSATTLLKRVITKDLNAAVDQVEITGSFTLVATAQERAIRDVYREVFMTFATWQRNDLLASKRTKAEDDDSKPWLALWGLWVLNFFLNSLFSKMRSILSTERRMINVIIDTGNRQGLTQNEIIAELRRKVPFIATSEAQRIARTEVTNAANAGAVQGAKSVGAKRKFWITSKDERVRRGERGFNHAVMHEASVPMSEPFIVSGERLEHPGDGNNGASIGNLANCRCRLAFSI